LQDAKTYRWGTSAGHNFKSYYFYLDKYLFFAKTEFNKFINKSNSMAAPVTTSLLTHWRSMQKMLKIAPKMNESNRDRTYDQAHIGKGPCQLR
jgi:hypothetical protein